MTISPAYRLDPLTGLILDAQNRPYVVVASHQLDGLSALAALVLARARPVLEDGAADGARPVAWTVTLSGGELDWVRGMAGEGTRQP
jgi:hypothetical protein